MITSNAINHAYPGEAEQAPTDLSLEFGGPIVTTLVGLNGSGKTTLMQVLPSLLPPLSGSVSINGTDVRPDDLLGCSIMAPSDRDFDNSSAGALTAYASLRPTWDQKLFDHYAQHFGFQMKRRKKLRKVSSGQAVIFTGTVALASGTPVTALDKIQAPLGVPTRYTFYEELFALAADCMEGRRPRRTFFTSSHVASGLENVVEGVVVLKNERFPAHESVDAFTSRICAIIGNVADVEGFLIDHPGTPVTSPQTFGPAREVIVNLCDRDITDREIAPYSLTLSPYPFQNASICLIQKRDQ